MLTPPLLVFDGDCGFCTACVRWIERRWPDGVARAIAWQDLPPETLGSTGLSETDVTEKAWWIDGARPRGGERAVAAALARCGGAWGVVGRCVDTIPVRWAARPVYALVARYRHLLPGATSACRT